MVKDTQDIKQGLPEVVDLSDKFHVGRFLGAELYLFKSELRFVDRQRRAEHISNIFKKLIYNLDKNKV